MPIPEFSWYRAYMVAVPGYLVEVQQIESEIGAGSEIYADFPVRVFVEVENWCFAGGMPLKMPEGWKRAGLEPDEPTDFDTRRTISWCSLKPVFLADDDRYC
ncbi:MAG: hypothetical protein GY771_16160 [bacterium]|nr:hypothetical protein [bacterium]